MLKTPNTRMWMHYRSALGEVNFADRDFASVFGPAFASFIFCPFCLVARIFIGLTIVQLQEFFFGA